MESMQSNQIDEAIIELYKNLGINSDFSIDIDKLSKEYSESLLFLEQRCLDTSVYINR